jgi:hypothetical protein
MLAGTVTLSATATDPTGVAVVKWFVDDVEVAADIDGAPWTRSWNSASVPNGTRRIFAKARNPAGVWGTSAVMTVTVNN